MFCDLIVALDVSTREEAAPILVQLCGQLRWVKIGLQMFSAYGPNYVHEVVGMGFNVFLDLKLHDIPNTVAKAVESLGALPIQMLTVHTAGGAEMMYAALTAQQKTNPQLLLLGVTVLTSMDSVDLQEIGVASTAKQQVLRLGQLAASAGLRGLVCSPTEVSLLRSAFPEEMQLITPGLRPASMVGTDDQKRTLTPAEAAAAGSSYIVVGRPILKAEDPAAAARDILAELGSR